jgi:hypothetical protein
MATTTEGQNRPVKRFQAGGVVASIWKNTFRGRDGTDVDLLAVTVDRRYKDAGGAWKSSASFRVNEIPRAILLLSKAFDHMATVHDEGDAGDGPVIHTEEEVVA